MVTNGCTGECCEHFTMQYTPEQRAKSIEAENDGLTEFEFTDDTGTYMRGLLKDEFQTYQYIQDMIIERPVREDGLRTYTCRHFDTELRICKQYDQRPGLCRHFPTEDIGPCIYEGCKFNKS